MADHDELRRQILSFLRDFKELMGQGNYYVKDHFKNIRTLAELGLTARQRDDLIRSLALEDYAEGPTPDQLKPGHYWVFGRQVDEVEIYIKLKIVEYNNGRESAVCISFHPAAYPMHHPFGRTP